MREARLLLALAGASMDEAVSIKHAFGSTSALFKAGKQDLHKAGIGRNVVNRIIQNRDPHVLRRHQADLGRMGGKTLVYGDRGFPSLLLSIPFPPAALFIRGRLPKETATVLAVIGSRRCTPEGERAAARMGEKLALGGVAVVSGLARGIDSAVLKGCLGGGGIPIGVLGTGLDFVYPSENRDLFHEVERHGAILSEFPLGTGPRKYHFPRRNRIISGLSRGVLVVEASDKSGTLITVDHAIEQDRLVMAMPGPVGHPAFMGTNRLIRDGAQVILAPEDAFASLGLSAPLSNNEIRKEFDLSVPESSILDLCRNEARTPDSIAALTGRGIRDILGILARLELMNLVKRYPGSRFLASDNDA